MTEREQQSPQQEAIDTIAYLLRLAKTGLHVGSVIQLVCRESGLSPKGKFEAQIMGQAEALIINSPNNR